MKAWFKILILAMALIMLLTAFVGCNSNEESNVIDDIDDEEEYDYFPEVDKNNYDMDFSMYMQPINNFSEYYILEESSGSPMDEAVYTRQERVKRYLGVDMIHKEDTTLGWINYTTILETAVMNKDGTLEALLSHYNGGVPQLIGGEWLMDFNDIDGIDLEAEYWNLEFMDTIELKGHRYLGFGDCNMLFTYLISFNKDMYEQYADADVIGGKSFYDMVREGEWTLDKMISVANLVYQDKTGDGKSEDDVFGFAASAWEPYRSFIHACGMNSMEQDASGSYKVVLNSDKYYSRVDTLINKMSELSESNSAWVDYRCVVVHDPSVLSLTTGRVLMTIYDTMHLPGYLDYEIEFGVLPLPMFDSAQKETTGYRSLQFGGYICVPTYVKNEQMVGETLEMYNFYSSNVKVTFYEKVLGKQVADVPDDAAMLDIIWNSICTEVGFTYATTQLITDGGNDSLLGCVIRLTNPESTDGGLASWFARHVQSMQGGFDNFYKGID
ncbi:MAG: hypothetical protein E7649_02620 [Ruminococcaceae bacterium]|nr:hypothetical protein [Oscillospiraceae bacterium]